jgi:hypothetical protein
MGRLRGPEKFNKSSFFFLTSLMATKINKLHSSGVVRCGLPEAEVAARRLS